MIRTWLENNEEKNLSSFATLSKDSRGRDEKIKECDIRTIFQRDRDRIIHSKAFRRLKHKTQVFIAPEGDHYRTRLTHTLEVAQIARTISRSLRLNNDLTEAAALGHDLGHTPFGHAGEDALNEVTDGHFEHNIQSLRVVEELEDLNLSWEVKDGIAHHTGNEIPETLEGQIVRIADRIGYINHDIDDAIRAGIINQEDLPDDAIEILGKTHADRIDTMVRDLIEYSWNQRKIQHSPDIKKASNELRSFLFDRVYIGSRAKEQEHKAKSLIKDLFNYYRKNWQELPQSFKEKVDNNLDQIIIDYVAGMSDVYAINKGKDLFIPAPWLQR